MFKKLFLPVFSLFFLVGIKVSAQIDSTAKQAPVIDSMTEHAPVKAKAFVSHQMNFIKTNLTSILLKNYSLQYERVLNRKISINLQIRMMPDGPIPLKNTIMKIIGDDDTDTKNQVEDLRLKNFAITPEVRLYLSRKGYGRGFYFAPFYRYASFDVTGFGITYTQDDGSEAVAKMKGNLTSNTGGFLLGSQTFLSKHIVLDIWLLGPHFGSGTGTLRSTFSKALSANEQNDLKNQLEDIDIPLTNKTVDVDANSAVLKLDGPWAGLRGGISLGVKF